ncbi:uncharacterized protein METZ01_LOCUS512262, partial [marine metagenome]
MNNGADPSLPDSGSPIISFGGRPASTSAVYHGS